MAAKQQLALTLTAKYHGVEQAAAAAAHFARVHQHGAIPAEVEERRVAARDGVISLPVALKEAGLVGSNSEGRRLIGQGAVEVDGERVTGLDAELKGGGSYLIRVGKRQFRRVSVAPPVENSGSLQEKKENA
jgi:tyrosyl-tRNA synthetase